MLLQIILAGTVGYLLGSISPAYFLGKLIKKIDQERLWLGWTESHIPFYKI